MLVLCGKFYFLLGFVPGSRQPIAPPSVIMMRDLLLIIFLGGCFWFGRSQIWAQRKQMFWFFVFLITALIFAGFQFTGEKKAMEILQHYLRNALLPLLAFPAGYFVFSRFENLRFQKAISAFAVINIILGVVEIFWRKDLMWVTRPTGILGDPLLCSAFLLLGVGALNFRGLGTKTLSLALIVSGSMVLFAASSLSAWVSWGLAVLAIGWMAWRRGQNPVWLKALGIFIFAAIVLLAVSQSSYMSQYMSNADRLDQKAERLKDSLLCLGSECKASHRSVSDRIYSNRLPFEKCAEDLSICLLGDLKGPKYHRVDSTWSSLTINWGLTVMLLYYFVFALYSWRKIISIKNWNSEIQLCVLVFFFYWGFSVMNTVIYKYPLNVLFYLCVAKLWYLAEKEKNQ